MSHASKLFFKFFFPVSQLFHLQNDLLASFFLFFSSTANCSKLYCNMTSIIVITCCYCVIVLLYYQDCYNKIIYSYTLILISFLSPSTPLLILLDYFASHWSLALCIFFSSLLSIMHKAKKLNMWKIVGRGKKGGCYPPVLPSPILRGRADVFPCYW